MYDIPTGFLELDNRVGGLIKPSCIAINCESAAQVYPFLLKLIHNFLEAGLRGAYVCLDLSAGEIKEYAKSIGIDIERCEKDNRIIFLDFFTKKQRDLIEHKKVESSLYDSEYVFRKMSQFLDRIKMIEDGFLVIDSISTLILNIGEKNTYKFVRTLKLLTRQFNLIVLGIVNPHIVDKQTIEMICSVSDMSINFRDSVIDIHYTIGIEDKKETFILSKEDGNVALIPILPKKVSRDESLEIKKMLSETQYICMKPTVILKPTVESKINPKELLRILNDLEKENILKKTPYCSAISCPDCNSNEVEFYLKCPECDSILVEKRDAIEHFSCGHIDFRENFEKGNTLVCPKCRKELRLPGVDYRKITPLYRCSNGHLFPIPTSFFVCTRCKKKFDLEEAVVTVLHSYEFTPDGKVRLEELK